MPPEVPRTPHPEPMIWNLDWSFEGEWQMIITMIDGKETHIPIRVEKFVDIDGNIKKAVSYGNEAEKLNVWFKLEDIKNTYKEWIPIIPNPYFNSRRFNPDTKRKDTQPKISPKPVDQSQEDIQGTQTYVPPEVEGGVEGEVEALVVTKNSTEPRHIRNGTQYNQEVPAP